MKLTLKEKQFKDKEEQLSKLQIQYTNKKELIIKLNKQIDQLKVKLEN